MEQWLRLLLQWVVELAPIIAVSVQRSNESGHILKTLPEEALTTQERKLKSQQSREIQGFIQGLNDPIRQKSFTWDFEQKGLQQNFAAYCGGTQFKLAEEERETAFRLAEFHKILENWPLKLYPSQILESNKEDSRVIPLKIFLAPPNKIQLKQFDNGTEEISGIELKLTEGIREFLNQNYSLHSQDRPTEFLAGAWESKRFHDESSIKTMFGVLRSEPSLILGSEINGEYLKFYIAYWGFGQENYYYTTIFTLPYRETLHEAARSRALDWKKIRDELIALGEDLEEINKLGKDNVTNLATLEKEEFWKSKGIDTSQLSLPYQINYQDLEKLYQFLIICHCLVAGWVADAYHLAQHAVSPLLPKLLPDLLRETFGKSQSSNQMEMLLNAIADLERKHQPEYVTSHSTLTRDSGNVSSLALSPDGQTLVSSCLDKTIRVWSLSTGKLLRTFTGHADGVSSVVISPDGQFLASGSYDDPRKNVKVWHLNTGKLLHTLLGHKKSVNCVAISPDGKLLASASNKIKIWHLHTGNRLCTLWHSCSVNAVAISPDGILASGSSDSKIRLWQLRTGELRQTLVGHSGEVKSVAISPDGTILASGSTDNTIKIWRLSTGKQLQTLTRHSGEVRSVAISSDGTILISGSADNTIKIWRLSTGELLQTLTGHSKTVNSLAFSPDGQFFVSGSSDKTIKIWHV
ncbi:MAG: WD40 repeat domain-containing protein [Chroococcidiopsidaceae cyanobacterium CP_BM_ER_R8_30]|nr:WD40 repeat domain-containing protein [Chroococcidiopsidaceae cyanobacterium CP_BM_ER_R8_30]